MQNHQQFSNMQATYNAFYGPNYITGSNDRNYARPSSNVQQNAPTGSQGHNIMPAPSRSSSMQYATHIGSAAAGNIQHSTMHASSSSARVQHTAHQGNVTYDTRDTAAPPQHPQQHAAQGRDIWQETKRFLMMAPIEQLRRKFLESCQKLHLRNGEYRTLKTSFEASEKRREEVEQENSKLLEQLHAKTQECENLQAFMKEDLFGAMQMEFKPTFEGLGTELNDARTALDATTQECEQLKRSNMLLERLAQRAMPSQMSDREVVEGFKPMNRPDVYQPLPSMLPEAQGLAEPTMVTYPASQPSAHEDNGYTHASNEGLQTMPPMRSTHSSPLIDLTEDEPEATQQDPGSFTDRSGGKGSVFASTASHKSSNASATTANSSEQTSSAPSPRIDSCDPAKVGNQLKRGAETETVGAVKRPRLSTYSWLIGSGNPTKLKDDWTKVRGGVPLDRRSSYAYNQDNEWEKRKVKYERTCKKQGVDPKDRPFEAIEPKPSVQRAIASAQRAAVKKRVTNAKPLRPAPSAASTGTPQTETVGGPAAEEPKTTQGQDQESSQGQPVISGEGDERDVFEAELEAELEAESEAKLAAELEAKLEAELEADTDNVDGATVGQPTEAAEDIPDGFLPDDDTDMDSLFGGDMDGQTSDDDDKLGQPTGPAIYPRPAGPALYDQEVTYEFEEAGLKLDQAFRRELVKSHDYSFTVKDLMAEDRTLMLIVARAHANAWAEVEEKPSENVIHDETSTAAGPAKKQGSPVKSRNGKGRVEKAPKLNGPAKKPRQP